jgi:hypothetical protein
MYGLGFKKNIIFDALNNNEVHKVNGSAIVQIYNVKNLGTDLLNFIDNDYKLVNLATEPLLIRDFYKDVFNINLDYNNTFFKNDFHTKHALNKQKYFYDKNQIIEDLKMFKIEYESKCI